jgi:hypothetical protein
MLFSLLLINRILARAGPSFFSSIKRNPWGEIRVTRIPLSTFSLLGRGGGVLNFVSWLKNIIQNDFKMFLKNNNLVVKIL